MFLSFIVPVYNAEDYIAECIDSLLNQDIPKDEYEIICINDGSPDGSLEILRSYETNYTNVKVVDQPNGGVCVARNTGLDTAKGDYIWFVDADDLIVHNCLGKLYSDIASGVFDRIIIGNYQFENITDLTSKDLPVNTGWRDSVVWRNIFKKDFLNRNELRFYPGLVFGEDALFLFECFRNEPKETEIDVPVYCHRNVQGSASTNVSSAFMEKRVWSTLNEAHVVQQYYERNDGLYPKETANRLMIFLWGGLFSLTQMSKTQAKPYMDALKSWGLYPYKTPPECTVTSSYQMKRNDFFGKFYDYLYLRMHRPSGFYAMRLLQKIMKMKNKNS